MTIQLAPEVVEQCFCEDCFDGDEGTSHITCCDDEKALCGEVMTPDVVFIPWNVPCVDCVVCVDLHKQSYCCPPGAEAREHLGL